MNNQEKLMHTVAITEAVNRYFAALDQKQFDVTTLSQIFAEDAKIVRPNGAVTTGPKAIGDSHRHSLSRFRATQHLTSGFLITLTNDTSAEFRANLVAMHLWAEGHGDPNVNPNDNYFLAGGVLTGHLLLQANEWRITEIANHVSWRRGTGFQQILQTEFNQNLETVAPIDARGAQSSTDVALAVLGGNAARLPTPSANRHATAQAQSNRSI